MEAKATIDHTEAAFERLIVREMVAAGWFGEDLDKGEPHDRENFDPELGLYTDDLIIFIAETQPKAWAKLIALSGTETKARQSLLRRVASEIDKRGTIQVLRKGLSDRGVKLKLTYPRPELQGDPDVMDRYDKNRPRVIRQVRFDPNTGESVDLVLTVNGLPTATCEIKNRFSGQQVEHAIRQYREDRDPRNLTLGRRAIVHFALDSEEVHMTTKLARSKTRFLPFNQGSAGAGRPGGAGNPSPSDGSHPTSYLWREVFAPEAWLEILERFVFVESPEYGGATVFPRYHQWDVVRRASADARQHGAGENYLVQHSAGSGKSKEIAWLAHELASAHNSDGQKLFTKVVVISDRRVLDQQLQRQVAEFEQVRGTVVKVEGTSQQLHDALAGAQAKVIITTLQKFPVVLKQLTDGDAALKDGRYAIIVDEAHGSQTGDSAKDLKRVLGSKTVEDLDLGPEQEDGVPPGLLAHLAASGRQPNLSFFAFTATPKPRTLELFGKPDSEGIMRPFHTYAMRQAIEEEFIVDVLRNYTTYEQLYRLEDRAGKEIELPEGQAKRRLAAYAKFHPYAKAQKAAIIVEHFREVVRPLLGGKAKAIIVTAGRQEAVRYKQAIDNYVARKSYDDVKSLVAFSGEVRITDAEADDYDETYTEPRMNMVSGKPLGERKLPEEFDKDEYGVLVVAEKYQTGFDQPKLAGMYVDKKLSGVNAVQTLSRLNRAFPGKEDTFILDFVNTSEEILEAFKPFYEETAGTPTDPNVLFDAERKLLDLGVIDHEELTRFADLFFGHPDDHAALSGATQAAYDRARELPEKKFDELRDALDRFVRFYAFLSQVIPYVPPETESLYIFAKVLRDRLGKDFGGDPAVSLAGLVRLTHYRVDETESGSIVLGGETEPLSAITGDGTGKRIDSDLIPMSLLGELVEIFNSRFGADLNDNDMVGPVTQITEKIAENDPGLSAQAVANTFDDFRRGKQQAVIDATLDVKGVNDKVLPALLDDEELLSRVTEAAMRAVYEQFRRDAEISSG